MIVNGKVLKLESSSIAHSLLTHCFSAMKPTLHLRKHQRSKGAIRQSNGEGSILG